MPFCKYDSCKTPDLILQKCIFVRKLLFYVKILLFYIEIIAKMCFFAVIGLTLTQLKYNFPDSPKIQSRSESLRYFASPHFVYQIFEKIGWREEV